MAGQAGSLAFEWAWSISTRENASGLLGVLTSGWKTAVFDGLMESRSERGVR